MAAMKKTCTCGKIINYNQTCECKKRDNNEYKREYYHNNKEKIAPLKSARWAKKRKYIINRDGGYCQRCFHKYGIINSNRLQVHHIRPRELYPELMYEDSNLICLCSTCNQQLGIQEVLDFEWTPDEYEFNL